MITSDDIKNIEIAAAIYIITALGRKMKVSFPFPPSFVIIKYRK